MTKPVLVAGVEMTQLLDRDQTQRSPRARGLALAALAVLLLVAGCQDEAVDRGAELLVEDAVQAVGDRDVRGLIELTTDDFIALPGRVDRATATRRLFLSFKLNGPVEVLHSRPEVDVDSPTSARVSCPFVVVRRGNSDPALDVLADDPAAWSEHAAELGEVVTADLSLVKHGETWLVQTARFF
jgi:hypothetical protein